ncbi:hypothetical protein FA95DRAFT_1496603 [Auriscalpium vulgare]|uniref:Uncharacterized protein n=1 Tax=Auriscalpium vulgare TaxID=40419 RepID=A0ACB8RLT0_9AGAM|nr:hypothetical protein FA95DRAFT_1496603 [Auriscalpium vulgare]
MCFATGFVTVVTVPAKDGEGEGAGERIVGGALWLQPGQKMEPSLTTFVRISPWKAIWSWGLSALSRLFLKYTPTIEKTLDKAFGARGVDRLDSWHLFEIAVDPDWEGQGLCSLLVRDGFARATPKPIHLEATTPKSRDRYLHFGFEIDEEHRFGVGEVDEKGLPAKGEAAVGWPDVVMTKVRLRARCGAGGVD